jgi:hypothetical protein
LVTRLIINKINKAQWVEFFASVTQLTAAGYIKNKQLKQVISKYGERENLKCSFTLEKKTVYTDITPNY